MGDSWGFDYGIWYGIYNSDHDAWICVNMSDLSGIYGLSNKEKGWKMINHWIWMYPISKTYHGIHKLAKLV